MVGGGGGGGGGSAIGQMYWLFFVCFYLFSKTLNKMYLKK